MLCGTDHAKSQIDKKSRLLNVGILNSSMANRSRREMKSTIVRTIVVIGLVIFSGYSIADTKLQKTLTFGVVPQQSASKLAKLWVPILSYLSNETGYKIEFKTAPNIPTFEKRLLNGEYDLAYMNPYHYTIFNKSPGYVAFAKAKHKKIKGIIVVRKDSTISSLSEFNNQSLAFPAPAAFAATLLPMANFKKEHISVKPVYVSSHDSVYRSVAKGLFPAGGGVVRTFNNVDDDIKGKLKILWTTEGYTPHALAAHPKVPAELVEKIQTVLTAMDENESGKNLLKEIAVKGFEKAVNDDWNDVRNLRIDMLNELLAGN